MVDLCVDLRCACSGIISPSCFVKRTEWKLDIDEHLGGSDSRTCVEFNYPRQSLKTPFFFFCLADLTPLNLYWPIHHDTDCLEFFASVRTVRNSANRRCRWSDRLQRGKSLFQKVSVHHSYLPRCS